MNIKEVIEKCNVNSVEEVTELLEQTAKNGHTKIEALLKTGPWTEWNKFVISQIPTAIKWKPKFVSEIKFIENGLVKNTIEIVGDDFIDTETFEHENFNRETQTILVAELGNSNATTKIFHIIEKEPVFVDEEQELLDKIQKGVSLTEDEIKELVLYGDYVVEENSGSRGRWSESMFTVVQLKDKYFGINWEKGLTEYQENTFYEQPFEVEKHTEIVTIEKVTWEARLTSELT